MAGASPSLVLLNLTTRQNINHTTTPQIHCQINKLLIFLSLIHLLLSKEAYILLSLHELKGTFWGSVSCCKDTSTYRQEELGIKPPTLMINGRPRLPPKVVCVRGKYSVLKGPLQHFSHTEISLLFMVGAVFYEPAITFV